MNNDVTEEQRELMLKKIFWLFSIFLLLSLTIFIGILGFFLGLLLDLFFYREMKKRTAT